MFIKFFSHSKVGLMNISRLGRLIWAVAVVFLCATFFELITTDAEARAGRGRSGGRSSLGTKKQSQAQQPVNQNNNINQTAGANATTNRGSMLRNVAGGMAGGFLGSMLFSSLGSAVGESGASEGGSGGVGMLEILLMAGLGYFVFRWWKSRQQVAPAYAGTNAYRSTGSFNNQLIGSSRQMLDIDNGGIDTKKFLAFSKEAIDQDLASDIFFKVQGAWTRRDVNSMDELVTDQMREIFVTEIAELKQRKEINRLENIAVRRVEVGDSWSEDGLTFAKVRFTANLLDYTVNEASGAVVGGSVSAPVKFEEDWIFVQSHRSNSANEGWRLAGIEQV